jgi:hypothetical protein
MTDDTDEILHRTLDTDGTEPAIQIARHIAEFTNEEPEELESTWGQFDHIIDEVFSTPPVDEAQVQVTFTYEGYRITVEQDGHAKFVQIGE